MLQTIMTPERFNEGDTWESFVEQMQQNQKRIRRLYEVAQIPDDVREAARAAVAEHGGRLYLTALAEDFCPDVVATLPIVARLVEAVPGLDWRIFVRSEHSDMRAAYAAEGITSIPTITVWTADFVPLGHLVERTDEAHAFVQAWEAEHEYARLRESDDPADRERFERLRLERMRAILDWHRQQGWQSTLAALLALMQRPAPTATRGEVHHAGN